MKVLFLDDDINRETAFLRLVPSAHCTPTSYGMIKLLQIHRDIDCLFLDHDLGGEVFVDSGREDCGMEVVRYLCENKYNIKQIFVHSLNAVAAKEMALKLRDTGWYDKVYAVPFYNVVKIIRDSGIEDL